MPDDLFSKSKIQKNRLVIPHYLLLTIYFHMKKLKVILFFMLMALITIGSSSCMVRTHENQGRHRGWYKNNNRHNKKVYVIQDNHHKQAKAPHRKSGKKNKSNKNHRDARR